MNFFHEALFKDSEKVIAFAGGGGKSVLINKICQECKKSGKTALVFSNYPLYIPPDTSIFIAKDLEIIKSQISREISKHQIVYLGKTFDGEKIEGFNYNEVRNITESALCDHVLIEIDQTQSRSFSGFDNLRIKTAMQTDRCVLIFGADALNQPNNETYLKSQEIYWQEQMMFEPVKIVDWLVNHKFFKNLSEHKIPLTVFINKVENIFHKNLTINFARQLKINHIDRVLYGSVYNSEFHEIK